MTTWMALTNYILQYANEMVVVGQSSIPTNVIKYTTNGAQMKTISATVPCISSPEKALPTHKQLMLRGEGAQR